MGDAAAARLLGNPGTTEGSLPRLAGGPHRCGERLQPDAEDTAQAVALGTLAAVVQGQYCVQIEADRLPPKTWPWRSE